MNLIDGALEAVETAAGASAGQDVDVPLSTGGAQRAGARARDRGEERGQARPAAGAHPARAARTGRRDPPAVVRFLEPVGSDLYLTVEAGGTTVQVRTDPDATRAAGRQRDASLRRRGACTCFGADGHNLRRRRGHVESEAALIHAAS